MKRLKLPMVLIAVATGIGFFTAFALTNASANNEHSHSEITPAKITTDKSIAGQAPAKTVDLLESKASPDQVTIIAGGVIQFNAKDGNSHRLALGEGGSEHEHTSTTDSGIFNADEGWRVRFDKPGTYFIHDHLNPNINILVVAYKPQV